MPTKRGCLSDHEYMLIARIYRELSVATRHRELSAGTPRSKERQDMNENGKMNTIPEEETKSQFTDTLPLMRARSTTTIRFRYSKDLKR